MFDFDFANIVSEIVIAHVLSGSFQRVRGVQLVEDEYNRLLYKVLLSHQCSALLSLPVTMSMVCRYSDVHTEHYIYLTLIFII